MPKRQKRQQRKDSGDGNGLSGCKPGLHPVFLVEIYKFHKVHQGSNSGAKNQRCRGDFRDERPIRIEVAENIADEPRYDV